MKRTPLRRKTPLRSGPPPKYHRKPKVWRRPEEDKVTPEVAERVFRRDRGCMAPILDPGADHCATKFGELINRLNRRGLTLQHVWLDYSVKGKRADSDEWHLLVICEHHHLDGWATNAVNLGKQRDYLKRLALERVGGADGTAE